MDRLRVYGWEQSPFTAKVFAYLKYKQLDPVLASTTLWHLQTIIKKQAGNMIMPVVSDHGQFLQDSSAIIDHYELEHPCKSVIPNSPLHIISAYLIELMGDEWLILAALHFRWHYEENHPSLYKAFGKNTLPGFPRIIQAFTGKKIGQKMAGYLPKLGVTQSQFEPLESNTRQILQALNNHLAQHDFLLGSRPSIGDFSLFGPIYTHLMQDPFPSKLIQPYPHIRAWVKKLNGPLQFLGGDWIESPSIPVTLLPVFQIWRDSHLPLIKASIEGFNTWCIHHPNDSLLPRSFGSTRLNINGVHSNRVNTSYILWMWQRMQKIYSQFSEDDQIHVNTLLNQLDILNLMQTPLPREIQLKQCRLHTKPW